MVRNWLERDSLLSCGELTRYRVINHTVASNPNRYDERLAMCMSLIGNHCHHLALAHDVMSIITQDQSTTLPLNLYEHSDFFLKTLRPLLAKWCCLGGILMSGVLLSFNVFSHDWGTCSRRQMDPFFFYISGSPGWVFHHTYDKRCCYCC